MSEPLLESSLDRPVSDRAPNRIINQQPISGDEAQNTSTLIEFPGVSRNMPEWRKQLSQRVREVQERRAREAAEAAAIRSSTESVACALPSAQLELVPVPEHPAMKPIVSKALERLERARQATADLNVPEVVEQIDPEPALDEQSDSREARKSKLVVVPPSEAVIEVSENQIIEKEIIENHRKPVRLITDGIEDQALSYLETCMRIPVVDFYPTRQPAGNLRRFAGGLFDLLVLGGLSGLGAMAIHEAGGEWNDPRVIELIAGMSLVLIFSYFTLMIALSGRTLGMRLMSLRTIDKRTGLIPTGGQSIKRAIAFTLSLVMFGMGFLYALIDRDGYTVHDRFSQTIVVHD